MKITTQAVSPWRWFSVFLIFIPVIVYLVYSINQSSPVFFADDFHLLKTLVLSGNTDNWSEKLDYFFQQHNEHRIVIPRLLTWLDARIEGRINWITLILIANLLWIGTLWFFWKAFTELNLSWWMFIPIPWMLLQPQYFDNVNWSISILQQSDIVFWYGLLIYLCSRRNDRWAILVAVIATFTHGNGIFSFLIGVSFAMLERRWKDTALWITVMLLVGAAYFIGFQKGQQAAFGRSFADPLRLLGAFFAFFGTLTRAVSMNILLCVGLGAVLLLTLAAYVLPRVIRAIRQTDYQLSVFDTLILGNLLFVALTAALVSVSRSWGGIESVTAPRYLHYSVFTFCWAYLVLLRLTRSTVRKALVYVILAGSVLFNGLCYMVYHPDVVYRKDSLLADETNYVHHRVFQQYFPSFNHNISDVYTDALSQGLCTEQVRMPKVDDPENKARIDIPITFINDVFSLEDASGIHSEVLIRIENQTSTAKKAFLYLKEPGKPGYWLPTHKTRAAFKTLLTKGDTEGPGFKSEFLLRNMKPGTYQVGVYADGNMQWTPQKLQLSDTKITVLPADS